MTKNNIGLQKLSSYTLQVEMKVGVWGLGYRDQDQGFGHCSRTAKT